MPNIIDAVPTQVERTAMAIHQAGLQVVFPNSSTSWAELDSDEFAAQWNAIGQHERTKLRAQAIAAMHVNGLRA